MSGFQVFLIVTIVTIVLIIAAVFLAVFNRRMFVRGPFRLILGSLYRKRIVGLENLPREGGCVVCSNHVSWIDGILILWMLPRNVRFVVDGGNFTSRLGKFLGGAFDTILMMSGPKAIGRALLEARDGLNRGDVIGIFPEGTITRTGQLQAFKPGMMKILKKTDAPIVPMHLEGMWGSIFSFSGGKFFFKWPNKFRRTLTLYIGEPMAGDSPLEQVRSQVQALGAAATVAGRNELPVLVQRVIRAWKKTGGRIQAADSLGNEVSGRDMLIRALILRRVLRRGILAEDETHVGVLLPPSVGGVLVNVAIALDRRVSANLNYTVSSDVLNHCNRSIGVRHVLTSEKFMEKMNFDLDAEVVKLETLRDRVTTFDKLIGFVAAVLCPTWLLTRRLGLHRINADDLLTVIFTSGSTGMPKGVMLSNANIAHNVDAIERAVRLNRDDTVLGILPFFHSFGYSVTLWAAMTLGPRGVYHFNPLDARQIGKLAQKYRATVLLGTPTFLRTYLRRVQPEQFQWLDVVVVGAEKMPKDLFDAFEQRFGVRPSEGYGATELSPLVSVNIPSSRSAAVYQPDAAEGSVGRPVPGVSAKVVGPDTGQELLAGEDGMLLISGANVMRGYAGDDSKTADVVCDGWYRTGDIAHIDAEGFIHITGRLSRFSKIGGEMVPHVRVEEEIAKLLASDAQFAGDDESADAVRACVTSVPCEKKGEKLVVLHLPMTQSVDEVRAGLAAAGLPNLFIPSTDAFIEVDRIPLLGTGKLDLKGIKDLAAARQAQVA